MFTLGVNISLLYQRHLTNTRQLEILSMGHVRVSIQHVIIQLFVKRRSKKAYQSLFLWHI